MGAQPHKAEFEAPKADDDADTSAGLASGATQAGTLLSSDNATDASINYAKGVGEGLINQQINDWLKQFGNAKVSLGSDKKVSGDMLIPLYDSERDVLFTQVGIRTGQERNTANLGVGYRQYLSDWMLGVNTFYDYDYTGQNKRLGVGAEAWRDYLKLAVNGYYRLTDWHQSVLSAMEDYDERPANGFDLRAEGYLPAWPNLGGTLKYEQYFGKGVSLSNSTSVDSLKDNPKALTAGMTYTPFPLMTLSAAHSVGDTNDTRVGLDLTYRLGVPWYRQVSPDSVDLMRSLAGSKYDFVDRNYEIVMQYRKQELLTISLPAATTAQAAETIPVVLTVSKAKYGIKSVSWNVDSLLTARGGRYQQVSPTELRVTLPAYVFGQRANAAQNYKISAVATDNNANQSNTAEMLIGVVPSENTVSNLAISPDGHFLPANDVESYRITGTVTDGKGAPLTNQKVTFTVDGLVNTAGQTGTILAPLGGGKGDSRKLTVTTGNDGKANITLRSKVAGEGQITATMDNGNSSTAKVTFVADSTTAAVRKVTLMDDTTAKPADGKNTFTYTALVQDKYNNTLANTSVSWSVNAAGVTLSSPTTQTDSKGQTTVKLLSGTRVVTNITVSAQSAAQAADIDADKKVSFIAGDIAADKSSLVASQDSITANGHDSSTLTLTLVDANNNPISGAASSLRASIAGLDNVSVSNFVEQGTTGVYVATLTGTKAGIATVTALSGSKKASTQTPKVTFSADKTTAQITDNNLIIAPDGAPADGKTSNGVKVTVTDKQGNPVSGMTVTFSVNKGATLTTVNGVSNASGVATATVISTKVGNYTITASVNGQTTTKETTFVSDIATAHVGKVTLVGSANSLPANDQSHFSYTVTVVDNQGNTVSGVKVKPKADKAGVTATATSVTDANGQTTITLASGTTAVADITVSAQVGSTASKNADKTVSFIADATTAQVDTVTLAGTDISKVADGKNTFTYTVTVKDGNGNLVSGVNVAPKADKTDVTVKAAAATDASGQTTVTLTSTTTAVAGITVSAQVGSTASKNADKTVSFIADATTAQVDTVTLAGTDISKVADGKNTFTYTVTVKDGNGNLVSGVNVAPKADKTNVTVKAAAATDASGQTTVTLTSTTTAVAGITVSAQVGSTASKNADKTVSFIADATTAQVDTVTLAGTDISKVADGKNTFTYTVTVKDGNGNLVSGVNVAPKADKTDVTVKAAAATDASGQTTVTLTSTTTAVAGITVSAQVGSTASKNADKTVSFIADATTAQVDTVTLAGTDISKVADGKNTFTYTVTVKDGNGNLVSGVNVAPKADKTDVTVKAAAATDASGQTTVTLTSTTTAVAGITVSAQVGSTASKNADKTVSFIADATTAQVDTVTLAGTDISKVADGKNTFTYTVTVKDGNGNLVSGVNVAPKADKTDVTVKAAAATDASGQTTVTLTSTTTAVAGITVSAQVGSTASKNADKTVSFIADATTAQVDTVTLAGTDISKVADGKNTFTYTVTVKDGNGNLVSGVNVAPKADKTDVTVKAAAATDASGQTTVTLTSTTTAVAGITVSAQVGSTASKNADKTVSFIADATTAQVDTVTLAGTDISKVADGKNTFTYTVTVKDGNGNLVSGVNVAPKADKTDVTVKAAAATDASGQTTVTLTSTTTAVAGITVSAQVGSTASKNADKTVSFIADVATAKVGTVLLNDSVQMKVADGKNTFSYTAQIIDAHGNPVQQAGLVVIWEQNKTGVVSLPTNSKTDAQGQATITLTSTTNAVNNVQVSAQYLATPVVNADKMVSFTADRATAKVSGVVLNDSVVSKVADGKNTFTYTVTITDNNSNPISGVDVSSSANKAGVTVAANGVTDVQGQTTLTLTSSTTAATNITVSAQVGSTASKNADKTVSFIADATTAQVDTVTLAGTDISKVADGKNTFTYTVTVKDGNGNLVSGVNVAPKADKTDVTVKAAAATDASGQTTVTLTSTTTAVAGITVSAQVGSTASKNADKTVSFIADATTAQVDTVTLAGTDISKVADGKNTFTYTVTVKDGNGNLVSGVNVAPKADKTDVTVKAAAATDASGQTTVTLTSTTTAVAGITVSAQVGSTASKNADKTVSFIADATTAQVDTVTLAGTDISKVADGKNTFTYTVTVKDGNGNLVSGVNVAPKADKTNVTVKAAAATDASGQTTVTLTSTTTAVAGITVSAQVGSTASKNADKTVSFIADATTAQVDTVTLAGTDISKVADGKNTFTYTVTVKDGNGNLVSGVNVAPKADKTDVTVKAAAATDASGQTTVTLTSTTTAVAGITVSAQVGSTASKNADKTVSFIADATTAQVDTVTLAGTDISKVADGKNTFTYTVTVKDGNGNLVSGVNVAPKADKTDVTVKAAAATDASGQTTVTLTSTTTAVAGITVSAQVGSTASKNADKTVSFIADATTAQVDTVTLAGTDISKVADGKNTFTYTVTVKDGNGNLVSGVNVAPKADKTDVTVKAAAATDASGQTTVTLTSTTTAVAGITVSAQVGSTASKNADKTVSFIADATTAQVDTVTLAGTDISKVADGKNTFTYTVTVKDGNGNLVSGVNVAPKADKTGATASVNGVTDADGQATVTLTSSLTVVNDITVSAQVGSTASQNADKTVSFSYGEVATISIATTDGKTTAVVGTQPAITLTVEDEFGRRIPTKTLDIAITGGSGGRPSIYPTSVTSDADGVISTNPLLADNTAEMVTVTASLSSSEVKGTLQINFVPDVISSNTSTITADPERIVADGQSTSTVIYVPKDRYGNIITDIDPSTISSTIIGMSNTEFTLSGWAYANKQYKSVVTAGTTTGSFRVIPVVDGKDGVSRTGGNIVTLVAGDIDITQSSIKAVPSMIIADGKSTSTLQFIPKDKFGNIIDSLNASSISQVLTGEATDMKVGAWSYHSNSQWYTAALTAGVMSGTANIMPTVNGENAAQNGVTNTLTLAYSSSVKDIVTSSVGTAVADGSQTNQVTVTIYGSNNQIISGATVNIEPSSKELFINGQNAVYTGTTDTKGQITVPMSSTFIGENQFTVESDQYSEVGNTSFGVYVSPTLSSISFDKVDLLNNGTDKMTVTFNPVDAKGRVVEGLDVSITSTDGGATLTSSGSQAIVSSTSSPSTYLISIAMTNYSLWKPDDQQYNLIPPTGVRLATVSISPVLCGSKTLHSDFVCTPTPANDSSYIGSGLGFKVTLVESNILWNKELYLTSSNVTENVYITETSDSNSHQNCSAPVSEYYSWMNDYGKNINIGGVYTPNTLEFKFNDNGESFNTIDLGFSGRGIGICDFPGLKKVLPNLSGRGSIEFTASTAVPKGQATFQVPIAGSRLDKGVIQGVSVYIYSK